MKRIHIILWLTSLVASLAQAQSVTYFRVADVTWGIASGPDGNLWFPTYRGIVKMSPWTQAMTTYPTPTRPRGRSAITAGPDGRMWFTLPADDRIAAITTDGAVTEYLLPAGTHPMGMTSGSDDRLWFGFDGGVGTITTAGAVTFFPVDGPRSVLDIVEGPDASLWFVESPSNLVGRITPAGVISHISTYPPVCCGPVSIARGNDGGLWLAFNQGDAIARLSTDGAITAYRPFENAYPSIVRNGPNAAIWFATERTIQNVRIGRIDADGAVAAVDLVSEVPGVMDMTTGADGNLWATLNPPPLLCLSTWCPPPDPVPPLGIVRVNAAVLPSAIPALSPRALLLLVFVLATFAVVLLR